MRLERFVHDVTGHLTVYLVAGTLVALGFDIAGNAEGGMTGTIMAGTMMPMSGVDVLPPWVLKALQGIGVLVAAIGASLYAANLWCGFAALRRFRFHFAERGLILQACGVSVAFLYVITSLVIGAAVNAVYLALVA